MGCGPASEYQPSKQGAENEQTLLYEESKQDVQGSDEEIGHSSTR